MKIKLIELEEDIKRVSDITKRPPSMEEYKKFGKYSATTIRSRWGSWNKALMETINNVCRFKRELIKDRIQKCKCCGNDFERKKKTQIFCSSSCAASINNKVFPKRKKLTKKCKECDNLIFAKQMYCKKCKDTNDKFVSNRSLRWFKETKNLSQIRQHARSVMKNEEKKCKCCGYSKHVEVCHIKEIKLFDNATLLKEINDRKNLVFLCSNCHWELDHKMLML